MQFYKKYIFLIGLLLANSAYAFEVDVIQQESNGNNLLLTCTIDSYDRVSKSISNTNIVKGFQHCIDANDIVGFQSSFIGVPEEKNLFIELENQPQFKYRVHNSDANLENILITDLDILETSVIPLDFENSAFGDCDRNKVGNVVECGGQVTVIAPATSGIITDLPGCIGKPNERQRECRGGTFEAGDTIAMRLDYNKPFPSVAGVTQANGLPVTDIYPVRLQNESNMTNSEPGHYSFIMAISETPGDFESEYPGCRSLRGSTGFTIFVTDENSETALGNDPLIPANRVCPLTEGKIYYINAKPLGGTTDRCGIPGSVQTDRGSVFYTNECRYELVTFFPLR